MNQALVFHIDKNGTILHLKSLGGMKSYSSEAEFLGNRVGNIMSIEIEKRMKVASDKVLLKGPGSVEFFKYEWKNEWFNTQIVYLREYVILVIVRPIPGYLLGCI